MIILKEDIINKLVMNNNSDVIDLPDENINVKITSYEKWYVIFSKIVLLFVNFLNLIFFSSIIVISLLLVIFIFVHIINLIDSGFIINNELQRHFNIIEYKFKYNILEIIISYILLIFILSDITRYIITDQISLIYKSLYALISNEAKIEKPKNEFGNLFLIIFSAILLELFLKLFSCDEDKFIMLAYLITGTLLSGAIFLYILYDKILTNE